MESQQKIELPPKTKRERLEKLKTFICFHDVQPKQIWGDQSHLRIPMFADRFFDKFGYKISLDQMMELRLLADEGENLHIQSFHQLGIWTNIVYQAKQIKKVTIKAQKVKVRPQTATQFNKKKYEKEFKIGNQENTLNSFQKVPQYTNTGTISRLKQTDESLEKKIIENALDKKWQYLIKVGEMNAWKKQINLTDQGKSQMPFSKKDSNTKSVSKTVNKIYKVHGQDKSITIVEEKENGEAEVLPLKVFDQKYQSMKKKVTKQEKLKNNMKGTMLLVLEKKDKVSKAKLCERISQRDHQLNYLLLQIMRMKTIFEQQEQILNECGVNM